MKESTTIIIKQTCSKTDENYFFIGFKKTIIIIHQNSLSFLQTLFSNHETPQIYFLSDSKDIFDKNIKIFYQKIENDENFEYEIESFKDRLRIEGQNNFLLDKIWKTIQPCISGYLIKQSYSKTNQNRIENFFTKRKEIKYENINEKDYVILRTIGSGSMSMARLIYHFEKEELFVLKQPLINDKENPNLLDREFDNYSKINHPYLPQFYGKTRENNYLVIEFINGQTLDHIDKMHLDFKNKLSILLQLIIVINYLHKKKYIFRDLKPDNIMIDENKTVVLIDFDRMIYLENVGDIEQFSKICFHSFAAPEISSENDITNKCDIYSIGQIIYYIITERDPCYFNSNDLKEYKKIRMIYDKCTINDAKKRIGTENLLHLFIEFFYFQLKDHQIFKGNEEQLTFLDINKIIKGKDNFVIGDNIELIDFSNIDMNNIHDENIAKRMIRYCLYESEKNNRIAQYNLGLAYLEGKLVPRDINKSIHYLKLAADQYYSDAQFCLGYQYYEGKIIKKNIEMAIHYFSLAAEQKHPNALCILGSFYYYGKYIQQDINKGIEYLSLSANQNCLIAQEMLAHIYEKGEFIKPNLNKAYHYYQYSANQNDSFSQYNLGCLYYEGKGVKRDINKAIYYFTIASNNNDSNALVKLGMIYEKGKDVKMDIQKAINYYNRAANQNNLQAMMNLAKIYYDGKFVKRDITKAIKNFEVLANHNIPIAQYDLGAIYLNYGGVPIDINKSIYYFTLAAKNKFLMAQYYLGIIYLGYENIPLNIDKSLYYFTLAAERNYSKAYYYLGVIYFHKKYNRNDDNKAIHFLTLAADKNIPQAQFYMGSIYYQGKIVKRDINKSIYYFSLAAKNGDFMSQCNFGSIYSQGIDVPRDINKGIYYYTSSANHNFQSAQVHLGILYYDGKLVIQDYSKAFYYFSLAKNDPISQYYMGLFYEKGLIFKQNMNKAIYYFTLSANQKYEPSLYKLGDMYKNGTFVIKNINKAIYYYSQSSYGDYSKSQYELGLLYIKNKKDINKGIDLLIESSNNGNVNASFDLGVLYHLGEYTDIDIKKSIHYYKQASSFNVENAKINLGIIYKNGFENELEKNIMMAIEYLEEAIRQKNSKTAMFILANIYLNDESIETDIDKSIELLMKSMIQDYLPTVELLCVALIKKYGTNLNIENIEYEFNKYDIKSKNLSRLMIKIINKVNFFDKTIQFYKNYSYVCTRSDIVAIPNNYSKNCSIYKCHQKKLIQFDITEEFYEGFGIDY